MSVERTVFDFALRLGACSLRPRSSGLERPVRTRHQSTLNARDMATMIFLRRDLLVLEFESSGRWSFSGIPQQKAFLR